MTPDTFPLNLQWLNTVTIDRPACIRGMGAHGNKVHAEVICTAHQDGRKACRGDQGGPLTTRGTPRELLGIWSWNIACTTKSPDIYTRVYPHLKFIREIMQFE